MESEVTTCSCHSLPAYWQKDARLKAGGWWECPVKRHAHNRTRTTNPVRRERLTQKARDQYDADPVARISTGLRKNALRRAKTLKRRRGQLGTLPRKG